MLLRLAAHWQRAASAHGLLGLLVGFSDNVDPTIYSYSNINNPRHVKQEMVAFDCWEKGAFKMGDPAIFAFSRVRRCERIWGLHCQSHDQGRANAAYDDLVADSAAWEDTAPTTWLGVLLKVSEAIVCLEDSENPEVLIEELRCFFKNRRTIDVSWLRDLRSLIKAVSVRAPQSYYATSCLRSILAGMSRPRLV